MSVYVDNMLRRATVGRITSRWSHLFADSTEELLAFGAQLGMRPEWLQHPGTHREHFDLIETKRARALQMGAESMTYPQGTGALLERRRAQCQCKSLPSCRWSATTSQQPPEDEGERRAAVEG